jgi:acyl-CoA thioesterase-2
VDDLVAAGPPTTLEDVLTLVPVGEGAAIGRSPAWGQRVYGGQFLGQALLAAARSLPAGAGGAPRRANSLHAYFLRAGDVGEPIEYRVATVRDGRAFALREVRALQHGREAFRMVASFHTAEGGLDYVPERPDIATLPGPDDGLPTYHDWVVESHDPARVEDRARAVARPTTLDVRYVDPPPPRPAGPVLAPQRMWIRSATPLGDAPELHEAALAYLSDETLIDQAMLPHGRRWSDDDLEGASLDHAMWFCRPARADEWLLLEQTVVSTAGARGQVRGDLYRPDGTLVATVCQEGLIRLTG